MKVFGSFVQGSLEWLSIRAGLVTASEIDALVSPKWAIREGKGVDTYVAQKAAEWWTGGALPGYQTIDMEIGEVLEREALPSLAFDYGLKVTRAAFVATDDLRCGASPDGIGDGFGVEIKCPGPLNHVKYLLAHQIPEDYVAQVQFGLWVTKLPKWLFMSYRRGLPDLLLEVAPEPKAQTAISEALAAFFPKLDAAKRKLVELNAGQRPKPNSFRESLLTPKPQPQPTQETEAFGLTP